MKLLLACAPFLSYQRSQHVLLYTILGPSYSVLTIANEKVKMYNLFSITKRLLVGRCDISLEMVEVI